SRYEILVVDDGSTDHTPAVVEGAQRTAACDIRGFRLDQRAGIPAARKLAVRVAQGNLIVFVECDEFAPQVFLASHLSCTRLRRVWLRDAAIYHYRPEVSPDVLPGLFAKEEERALTALRFITKNPTLEARMATCLTPIHRWANALQRGFGAVHAGNTVAWVDRARHWGL